MWSTMFLIRQSLQVQHPLHLIWAGSWKITKTQTYSRSHYPRGRCRRSPTTRSHLFPLVIGFRSHHWQISRRACSNTQEVCIPRRAWLTAMRAVLSPSLHRLYQEFPNSRKAFLFALTCGGCVCFSNAYFDAILTGTNIKSQLIEPDEPFHQPWQPAEEKRKPGSPKSALVSAKRCLRRPKSKVGHHVNLGSDIHSPQPPPLVLPRSSRPKSPTSSTAFRKALVFERQIVLDDGGKSKRWSLHIPAATMNPEMVQMMLELKDLNTFFKADENHTKTNSLPVRVEEIADKISKPLNQSKSDGVSAPLVQLSGKKPANSSLSLAVRRGKEMLPPLAPSPNTNADAYPSIPTAFLGSPSTYSPLFEFSNRPGDPSLDLQEMITSLRSQCASIPPTYPLADGAKPLTHPAKGRSPTIASSSPKALDQERDDWDFAVPLLTEVFHDSITSKRANSLPSRPLKSSLRGLSRYEEESSGDTTASTINSSAMIEYQSSRAGSSDGSLPPTPLPVTPTAKIGHPPSSPLPPRPAMVSTFGQSKEVRGILKSSKSVRFASLPIRRCPIVPGTPSSMPRHSAGSSTVCRPSPLRKTFFVRYSVPQTSSESSSPPSTPSKNQISADRDDRGAKANMPGIRTRQDASITVRKRAVSSPPKTRSTEAFRKDVSNNSGTTRTPMKHQSNPQILTHRRRSSPISSQCPPTPPRLTGTHSLSRIIKCPSSAGKENKGRATPMIPSTPKDRTINENALRRSGGGQGENSGQKSRMPVPLRNILTRFK